MAACQVASGAGSSSTSPAQTQGTSYPCPGGNGVFAECQGCSCTPSPGRAPMGALELGRAGGETVPGAMLVPAWGAQWSAAHGWWAECCSRMAATSSCSGSVGHCHGIAISQQPGSEGSGDSYFGQPKAPQLSCFLQHRACTGAGTRVLSWAALGEVHTLPLSSPAPLCPLHPEESHIPEMRQPRAELTWMKLNPSRQFCASQPGATRAEGGTTASGPAAEV